MKVRATAVAAERSNAIGSVELECTPHGLVVVYLGVGAFQVGYAPGALTAGTRVVAPWSEVREARVEGDQLYLELAPELTPHSRLLLQGFSTGDYEHHREATKQRLVIWIAAGAAALLAAMISALTIPRFSPRVGASATLLVGGLAALSIVVVGLLADRQIGRAGLDGDAAREAFAADLSRFVPHLIRLRDRSRPAPQPFTLPSFEGWIPRTTAAVVITLTACLLGAVLTARWLLSNEERREREVAAREVDRSPEPEPPAPLDEPTRAAPPPPSSASPTASATPAQPAAAAAEIGERCTCRRSDSLLWAEPIPRLGVVVLSRKITAGPVRKRTELEIAAVNSGDQDVRELSMALAFHEQDPPPSNKRYPVAHRSVYFEGPLTPGQAIKWSVEARGSSVDVDRPLPGEVGADGSGAAPTNLLAGLLQANHRPVRLYGAMLLTYLGDPRAKEAVLALKEALREDEAPYLERLTRALSELRTCELAVDGVGAEREVRACVFNASNEQRDRLALRVRALDGKATPSEPTAAPPSVVTEATVALPAPLAAQEGVRVRAKFELGKSDAPAAFEAFTDRVDLLP